MNTARFSPAVVSTSGGDIIVIGGYGLGGVAWTGTVEIFQVKTRRWYKLTNIPPDVLTTAGEKRAVFIGGYSSTHCLCRNVNSLTE